ncbi:MAG: gliding motility-associated C-terminal domain-containing protein [Taibaiella sp.]|nr:gliding motility-associated C-terminal domain-containing protein [Taibaiella sp.]
MNKIYTLRSLSAFIICILSSTVLLAQPSRCDTITLSPSVHVCNGATTPLAATISGPLPTVKFTWSPPTGLSDPTILNPTATVGSSSRSYTLQVYAAKAKILDFNSAFDYDNDSFTSNYTYKSIPPITPGQFTITTDPNTVDVSYPSMADHTGSPGPRKMMVVSAGGLAGDNPFWEETVPVGAFNYYYISAWVALLKLPDPFIKITVNGTPVGTTYDVSTPIGVWQHVSAVWYSSSAATADIAFIDSNATSPSAFAIDDITLQDICIVTASTSITVSNFAPNIKVTKALCSKTVNLTAIDTIGTRITSRVWLYGDGNTDTGTAVKHTFDTTGTYTISFAERDSFGCVDTVQVRQTINTITNSVVAKGDTTICKGAVVQLSATGATRYYWTPGKDLNDSTVSNPRATPSQATTYVVTGVDSNNCIGIDSVQIKFFSAPTLYITPNTNPVTCSNSSIQLFVSGAKKYIWQPGLLCDSNTSSHPIVTPQTTTTFYVTGNDGKGCESVDSITIYSLKDSAYMPNAFTPDNDGLNDVIYPTSYCNFIFERFSVFNRWGQPVFTTTMPNTGWDGKLNGQPQPKDVYMYLITGYKISDGQVDRKHTVIKGNITLLR